MSYKIFNNIKIMAGSRTFELLDSKDPIDHKIAKRLTEYARKAEECNYELKKIERLRAEFKDVL